MLNPRQAVDAALLLRAERLVPIHYGLNDPPYYVEVDKPLMTLRLNADARGMAMIPLSPGDNLEWNK